MRLVHRTVCFCWVLIVALATVAHAQNITSTLVGQVSDPAGNGVPNANITVTNIDTGISTAGITSSSGSYSVSGLLAGTYTVSVEAKGFSTYKASGIVVQSAQTARVDVALKVGEVTETVEVTGAAPLIHTDSISVEATLNTEQITNLPSAYENIASLYAAIPGATAGGWLSNPQIAGSTHWGSGSYSLNGVAYNDSGNGGAAYAYASGGPSDAIGLQTLPARDTLQEFRAVAVNANAEFKGVVSILMVTKQGTNQFHGSLYENFQNAYLNANSYTLNANNQPRPKNNMNQFGGTIGGPIFRNKAFFFFAPIYLRKITSGTAQLSLPTMAMRGGDFSALQGTQLYNPFTGQPFPNNQIPASMITSQAQTLLKYLPPPTITSSLGLPNSAPNYYMSVPVYNSMDSYTARVDYKVSAADSLFGVYLHNTGAPWNVFLSGPPQYGNATDFGYHDQLASLTETHIFSPTMMNDFRAAWFVHTSIRNGQNQDFDPTTLFPQLTPGSNRGLPTMSVTGYGSLFNDYGYANGQHSSNYSTEFNDNLTKVVGNHTFKVGFNETGYKNFSHSDKGSLGSFSFSGVWTGGKGWPSLLASQGNAFADFLIGTANSATMGTVAPDSTRYNRDTEAYGQDTWQATPRLTLYYGIRYMYQASWGVQNNARSWYDPANNKIALPQNSPIPTLPTSGNPVFFNAFLPYFETTQSIGLSQNYMKPSKNYWAPRVGFAVRPFGDNTVLRGGYGLYYTFTISAFGAYDASNLPFGQVSATNSSKLPGKPTSTYLPDVTFQNPFGNASAVLALNPALYYVQPDLKNSMIQQWNLSLEHQFRRDWMVRASYVGSISRNLPWYASDINVPYAQTPNLTIQQQRLHQPWSAINSVRSGGSQYFNQLQLETIRRFTKGISLQLEYSWTRSLDNVENSGNPQRWYLPNADYGNSSGIRTHSLIANYTYQLPFGGGRKWLNNSSRFVNTLVSGWQASGITTYASGTPFSVSFSVPTNYIGWWGGRANTVPGVPVYTQQEGHGGHDVIGGVRWFNPAAFGPSQPWTWGNSGRNILWGPGYWNWDISALKQIPITENRVRMTFHADFLDAFNHFNLGNPNATVGSTQYGGIAQPSAGLIYGGSGNRSIQVGLRLTY